MNLPGPAERESDASTEDSVQPQPSGQGVHAHRAALSSVFRAGQITLEQVWLSYFEVGGSADLLEVEAYVQGALELSARERDALSAAANERLDQLTRGLRVPYSRPLRAPSQATGPLPALAALLAGTKIASAGELDVLLDQAGTALGGVRLVAYLADYQQLELVPVPGTRATEREPLSIEATLAGRAYTLGATQAAYSDPQPRLWVPLLDGIERLGVLDVMLPDAAELTDPLLREQCGWVASMLAHLVVAAASVGDRVDAARRTKPRSPAAELVWSLLPPLTAGTEQFTLSGLLEPAYEVGGDAFDYALGPSRVQFAVFDSMGHTLGAGLISAAALAAYRAARRAEASLAGQAAAIDDALSAHFPDAFATGVLAELDLDSGRLRYLIAGHPAPLLVRESRVTGEIGTATRPPFGLGTGTFTVGEASLQPGDWLVLYTDGVTEARAADGEFFGQARLRDFLEREASTAHPPPETARRLIHAVLRHQDGILQDDATILLAQWEPAPPSPPL